MKEAKNKIYFVLISFFLLIPLLVNIKAISHNCYNAIDFSIYQQAIFNMSFENLNPFVTIRNVKVFNDHFDPMLYSAAIFTAIFGKGFIQLLIYEWLFYLLLVLSIYYVVRKENRSLEEFYFLSICTIFCKLILSAIYYPIHPTTWTVLPTFWLAYSIAREKYKGVVLTTIILCLLKESFSFAIFPLSFFYLYKRNFKLGTFLLLITLGFISFELHFRAEIFGETTNYSSRFLGPLLSNPVTYLTEVFKGLNIKAFFKSFYPFLFPLGLFFFKSPKTEREELSKNILLPISLVFFPLLFVQVLANKINFQYGAQLAGFLIASLILLNIYSILNRKTLIFTIILFLASGMGTYTKNFKFLFANKTKKCVIDATKTADTNKIHEVFQKLSAEEKVLATGGVIPQVLKPNKKFYHYKGFSEIQSKYDYLLLELNKSGDVYPANHQQVSDLYQRCKPSASEVYLDNKYYFLAKGSFTNCVQ